MCIWKCTQKQFCCYTPKGKRHRCHETPVTGCTGSYQFDNLQCVQRGKSQQDEDIVAPDMSDMETQSHRSPHVNARHCGCVCDHLDYSQWSRGCKSTQVSESAICAFSCYKYNNLFHYSRHYINQSNNTEYLPCVLILYIKCWGNFHNNSGIWCLKTLRVPFVRVGYKWRRS